MGFGMLVELRRLDGAAAGSNKILGVKKLRHCTSGEKGLLLVREKVSWAE